MSQSNTEAPSAQDTLELRDTRTDKTYNATIRTEGPEGDTYVRAMDLRAVKREPGEFGLLSYDPAFMNTASCRSAITFIDGDKGILRYRGYPIEQLAENATFLEVAYLLRHGDLPNQGQYDTWVHDITFHTYVHENIRKFLEGFRYDAHPMSMMCSATAALSSFYPQARDIHDPQQRYISMIRLMAKLPTIAAFAYRHVKGLPFIYPDNDLGYTENFLSMIARMSEPKYEANPVFVKALEVLFILHADHEQNCSTSAVRAIGSSGVDPFSAVAGGIAAERIARMEPAIAPCLCRCFGVFVIAAVHSPGAVRPDDHLAYASHRDFAVILIDQPHVHAGPDRAAGAKLLGIRLRNDGRRNLRHVEDRKDIDAEALVERASRVREGNHEGNAHLVIPVVGRGWAFDQEGRHNAQQENHSRLGPADKVPEGIRREIFHQRNRPTARQHDKGNAKTTDVEDRHVHQIPIFTGHEMPALWASVGVEV